MKKILLSLLIGLSFLCRAQNTDTENTTQFNVIRNETSQGGNTRGRIADAFEALNGSKLSRAGNTSLTVDDTVAWVLAMRYSDGRPFLRRVSTIAGSGGTYDGTSPSTVGVGGLDAGTSLTGLSALEILEAILAPYVNPAFTSFGVTGQSTGVEVGTTISGSKTFAWGMSLGSGTVATIDIYDITAAANLLTGTTNDGAQNQTITTIQLNTEGATQQWRGVGNDTGGGPSTFNSGTFTVTGYYAIFYGAASAQPTNSATIRALPSSKLRNVASTLTLATGTTETKFYVSIENTRSITGVIDVSALDADITSSYVLLGTYSVLDAGSTSRTYKLYEMTIGSPYATSHNHIVTYN